MNLDKFEKIDGREALRKIADKAMIYDHEGFGYFYDSNGISYRRRPNGEHKLDVFDISVAKVASNEWYIKKPFDVRQAMRERPNEWVGKYKKIGDWWEVGFDESHFNVIAKRLDRHLPVDTTLAGITFPGPEELDACIPIEDVPEEATR